MTDLAGVIHLGVWARRGENIGSSAGSEDPELYLNHRDLKGFGFRVNLGGEGDGDARRPERWEVFALFSRHACVHVCVCVRAICMFCPPKP